jgi:hypothetical protein
MVFLPELGDDNSVSGCGEGITLADGLAFFHCNLS